jgi:hypothetical protein
MKLRIPLFLFSLLLTTSIAMAQCPVEGLYLTADGAMLEGRASIGWCALDGTEDWGEEGNIYNAESYDGMPLGDQWKIFGQTIAAPGAVEIDSQVDPNGNGWIAYSIEYEGGQFEFDENGPWGTGEGDITGGLSSWDVQVTVTFIAYFPVGATSNITATGYFENCPEMDCLIEFFIANALTMWRPEWGGMPLDDYPPFLCDTDSGEQEDICCVVMQIGCTPVATQQTTWGYIKSLY